MPGKQLEISPLVFSHPQVKISLPKNWVDISAGDLVLSENASTLRALQKIILDRQEFRPRRMRWIRINYQLSNARNFPKGQAEAISVIYACSRCRRESRVVFWLPCPAPAHTCQGCRTQFQFSPARGTAKIWRIYVRRPGRPRGRKVTLF